MASRLPLRGYRYIPGFLRWTLWIRGQLAEAPGLVGYSLDAKLFRRTFWTLSAWTSREAVEEFGGAGPAPVGHGVDAPAHEEGDLRLLDGDRGRAPYPLEGSSPAGRRATGHVREVLRLAGREYTTHTAVTEVGPGLRYRFAGSGTSGKVQGGRTVEGGRTPGSATFTYDIELEPEGIPRAAQPLMGWWLTHSLRRDRSACGSCLRTPDQAELVETASNDTGLGTRHLCRLRHGHRGDVADAAKVITAEELDSMSPDERAHVVREHIVTDPNELPDGFRQRVEATATRLAEQLRPATG